MTTKTFYCIWGIIMALIITLFIKISIVEEKASEIPVINVSEFETETLLLFNDFKEQHQFEDAILFESQGYFEGDTIAQINEVIKVDTTIYTYTKYYYNNERTYSILPIDWNMDNELNVIQQFSISEIFNLLKIHNINLPEYTTISMRSPKDGTSTWYYFNTPDSTFLRVNAGSGYIERLYSE